MTDYHIREITDDECMEFGQLLVEVYKQLEGFPSPEEQPSYYHMLANIGSFLTKPKIKIFVAKSATAILGGVVYFGDMAQYGSGGSATKETHASGIRLLGVSSKARGLGVGKALTQKCLEQSKLDGNSKVVLHTTASMQVAWQMYEKLGFQRAEDLDFMQEQLPVFGFRLSIK